MVLSEDSNGIQYLKPFRLLSNTARTNLEIRAVQRDIVMPSGGQTANFAGGSAAFPGANEAGGEATP